MSPFATTVETRVASPRHAFSLTLLGRFALEVEGERVTVATGAQRLLAFIGLRGPAGRDYVSGSLWPDVSEEHAHGSLRTMLWRIRTNLPGLVDDCDDGVLTLSAGTRVDAGEARARDLRALAEPESVEGGDLMGLLGMGDLLPGWYDDWVIIEREQLRQLRLHALETVAAHLARRGRYGYAIHALLRALEREPLRESAHRSLIRMHLEENNVEEALRQYHALARLLRRELGVEPSELTRRLFTGVADVAAPRTVAEPGRR
jgi:DNA-binding SARP family transcriptional activator